MIFADAISEVRRLSTHELSGVGIARIVAGLHFTMVQLTSGACGLAMTEAEDESLNLAKRPRQTGEHAPGKLARLSLLDLLDIQEERPVLTSVKWALLNACSSHLEPFTKRRIERGKDVLEWIDCSAGQRITLVGAFQSQLARLALSPCELRVLELKPDRIPDRYRHLYVPKQDVPSVLANSNAVIITGSALVNQTFSELLAHVQPAAQVALMGPSAGLFPDLLFERGVSLIGTIRITDPNQAFRTICEGGSAYHLFTDCAEKVVIFHE